MATSERPADKVNVGDPEFWREGPPVELFARMRAQCPVHWSGPPGPPDMPGFWSVTKAGDIEAVSRDWKTYSSQRTGIDNLDNEVITALDNKTFIAMDPPRHDRFKTLFLERFTPSRIAADEPWIRGIVDTVFRRVAGRETIDLVEDVAQPIVSRVIHGMCGIPEEEDAKWAAYMNRYMAREDPGYNPGGLSEYVDEFVPFLVREATKLIEPRRRADAAQGAGDEDLISVMVNGEVEGAPLTDEEIAMTILLVLSAGNDSTKSTYVSAMKALMENPDQLRLLVDDPSLIPGAVEEALRMFPPFTSFCRTATRDVELSGQVVRENEKIAMWYSSGNRDESRYENPDVFDVRRNPEHQAFGGGGRHFCLGAALARLELRLMIEGTVKRYPGIRLVGETPMASSLTLNQYTAMPVRLA
ncbi:cytochrome P450 [Amycolatopsis sp. Poz14]|uniref:cytochrome P450 n=1 Tax=Amycolatopsis sp. Poz14 TaxID=1447705 RepID=UPI001EE86C35|nr:cytochrome P450 [Amycolatopsis sp. Poz14]MCG3751980.1 cytochrome P450 [Amycolatopsis sp. Poz14]